MAHLIDMSNNKANIAYVGETPWHGLGTKLIPGQSIEKWREAAGLDWEVKRSPALFKVGGKHLESGTDIMYRSDTHFPLGNVSKRYKEVQPEEIFDFYKELTDLHGFEMETAGSLDNGKRIWALAKTGKGFKLGKHDLVNSYVLLATSYDKSMATRAMFTSVRVVCNNTLSYSLSNAGKDFISIPHSASFDKDHLLFDLGIVEDSFKDFADKSEALTKAKIKDDEAMRFIIDIMEGKDASADTLSTRKANIIKGVFDMYKGKGHGSSFETANGTLWGAVNSITEYVDHYASRNVNNRMRNAWFGNGANIKSAAFDEAVEKVAAA